MGVLDKFLDIMKLSDDEDYEDDFFDDDYEDDDETIIPGLNSIKGVFEANMDRLNDMLADED